MIVEHINAWYEKKAKREQAERRETYGGHKLGPSNLGDCLRKTAWLLSGVEPLPLTPETARTFELGSQRGEALEKACKEIWPDAKSQVPIRIPIGKYEILGTCDLWIPGLLTVVDFKTQAAFGFGLLAEEGVSEEYALQVHAYRAALFPGSAPAIRALVIYEAKDSDPRKSVKAQQLAELEVPWTQALEDKYQARLRELEGILIRREQGNLDPRSYKELPLDSKGKKSWKCRYCSIGEDRGACYR